MLWEIKGSAQGHSCGNGGANLDLRITSLQVYIPSKAASRITPIILPKSKNGKKKKKKMAEGLSQTLFQSHDILWQTDTSMGQSGCWSWGTERGKYPTSVLTVTLTQQDRKEGRKVLLAGVERIVPVNLVDAPNLPEASPEGLLTAWHWTRAVLNT